MQITQKYADLEIFEGGGEEVAVTFFHHLFRKGGGGGVIALKMTKMTFWG